MLSASLFATAYSIAAMIVLIVLLPCASSAFNAMMFAPGAIALRVPLVSKPLPATMPATCVPWPQSSYGCV